MPVTFVIGIMFCVQVSEEGLAFLDTALCGSKLCGKGKTMVFTSDQASRKRNANFLTIEARCLTLSWILLLYNNYLQQYSKWKNKAKNKREQKNKRKKIHAGKG